MSVKYPVIVLAVYMFVGFGFCLSSFLRYHLILYRDHYEFWKKENILWRGGRELDERIKQINDPILQKWRKSMYLSIYITFGGLVFLVVILVILQKLGLIIE